MSPTQTFFGLRRLRDVPKRRLLHPVQLNVFRVVPQLTESLGDAKEASKPLHLDENNLAFLTFIRRDVLVTYNTGVTLSKIKS